MQNSLLKIDIRPVVADSVLVKIPSIPLSDRFTHGRRLGLDNYERIAQAVADGYVYARAEAERRRVLINPVVVRADVFDTDGKLVASTPPTLVRPLMKSSLDRPLCFNAYTIMGKGNFTAPTQIGFPAYLIQVGLSAADMSVDTSAYTIRVCLSDPIDVLDTVSRPVCTFSPCGWGFSVSFAMRYPTTDAIADIPLRPAQNADEDGHIGNGCSENDFSESDDAEPSRRPSAKKRRNHHKDNGLTPSRRADAPPGTCDKPLHRRPRSPDKQTPGC